MMSRRKADPVAIADGVGVCGRFVISPAPRHGLGGANRSCTRTIIPAPAPWL